MDGHQTSRTSRGISQSSQDHPQVYPENKCLHSEPGQMLALLLITPRGLIFKCGGHFRQPCLTLFLIMRSLCLCLQGRPRLHCHVCYAYYQDYKTYFRHLINNSCVKQPTVDKSLLKSSLTIYAPSSAAEVRSFPLSN